MKTRTWIGFGAGVAAIAAAAVLYASVSSQTLIPEETNEGEDILVDLKFYDQSLPLPGVPIVPTAIHWWVYDEASGQLLYQGPPTTPGTTVTIRLPPHAQRIWNDSLERERHVLSVQFVAGGLWTTPDALYVVRNLRDRVVGEGPPGTWGPTPYFPATPTPGP